jgi:hypothetical protein
MSSVLCVLCALIDMQAQQNLPQLCRHPLQRVVSLLRVLHLIPILLFMRVWRCRLPTTWCSSRENNNNHDNQSRGVKYVNMSLILVNECGRDIEYLQRQ